MIRRLLLCWAVIFLGVAVHADPLVSFRTTGEELFSFSPPPDTHGYVRVKTGYGGSVAAGPAGTPLGTLARFEFQEGGAARYGFAGIWHAGLELTDETTGETVSTILAGSFEMQGCCTFPLPPLTASLFPRTVVAGGHRYTVSGTGLSAAPQEQYERQYLGATVTYNPPDQPGLAFATQPGGKADSLWLDPQPVVVMRKPDGAIDTTFNGPVTLIVTPDNASAAALTHENYGKVTQNAVAGVAVFTGLSLTHGASNVTLTAFSGVWAGADSLPFSVGSGVPFAAAIRALRIAGGLDLAVGGEETVSLANAVALARQAAQN